MAIESDLYVFEYGGTARSGKGTIVKHISEVNPDIRTDETGADYRALTKSLLISGVIEPDNSEDVVEQRVGELDQAELLELSAERDNIVEEFGLESLYDTVINNLVPTVGAVSEVRKTVKRGFVKRVEAVRDSQTQLLLVDGRNLAPIVESIPGVSLIMRTFVSCYPIEAAFRELVRGGWDSDSMDMPSPGLFVTADAIEKRNNADASREIDPVIPDEDAIDYWYDTDAFHLTVASFKRQHPDIANPIGAMFTQPGREWTDYPRTSVGMLAVSSGRQIFFDTTPFRDYDKPKQAMLDAATQMFGEALMTFLLRDEIAAYTS